MVTEFSSQIQLLTVSICRYLYSTMICIARLLSLGLELSPTQLERIVQLLHLLQKTLNGPYLRSDRLLTNLINMCLSMHLNEICKLYLNEMTLVK